MTDKVQKIREEVERLYNQSLADEDRQADRGLERAASASFGKSIVCKEIIFFIDSMPEEPVSDKLVFKAIPRLLEMVGATDRAKAYTAKLANTLESEGYHTDAKIVRESIKIMNGEKVAMATMDEEPVNNGLDLGCGVIWKDEEPVSEDLQEELHAFVNSEEYVNSIGTSGLLLIARHFVDWQKEQFEKNRLAACDRQTEKEAEIESDFVMGIIEKEHRQPTFDDAIKYGMRLHKKQMMAKAVDVEVKVEAGGYPYIPQMELYDYDKDIPLAKEGDKYKVVLIKEE